MQQSRAGRISSDDNPGLQPGTQGPGAKTMNGIKMLAAGNLMMLFLSGFAYSSQDWEKNAFLELSKTPNAVTWAQWNQLETFEKQALYETRYIRRVDAKLAFAISQRPKAIVISVDEPEYYKRQRITPSVNVPYRTFTEAFIQKNLKWFNTFEVIILYCR
jgi:hypothetical protein